MYAVNRLVEEIATIRFFYPTFPTTTVAARCTRHARSENNTANFPPATEIKG
jgi:hypothetical protein